MLIRRSDGQGFIGGPLDVILILHDIRTGRFHPAFAREAPLPGPIKDVTDTTVVRLKSEAHHTVGFEKLEEAQASVRDELSQQIKLEPENIVYDPIDWHGADDGVGAFVVILPNWRRTTPPGKPEIHGVL